MGLDWKKLQLKKARARKVLNRVNQGPTRKPAQTSKLDFLKALGGTGGVYSHIAENLNIKRETVKSLLERDDWADVRQAWQSEVESTVEEAEKTIRHAIVQRYDLPTAANTSKWLLSKIKRETYGEISTTIVEGGKNPIKTLGVSVSLETLNLPREIKRQILEAMDAQEEATKKVVGAKVINGPDQQED